MDRRDVGAPRSGVRLWDIIVQASETLIALCSAFSGPLRRKCPGVSNTIRWQSGVRRTRLKLCNSFGWAF